MRGKTIELFAILATLGAIGATTVWPIHHEDKTVPGRVPRGTTILTLTAVAATGTWTDEDVSGWRYWHHTYPPARPVLQVGRPVLLRLKSADVTHSFYAPALGVGPVQVYPGHVAEVLLTPVKEGVFPYYCTTVCGAPHFGMRGEIVVVRGGARPPPSAAPQVGAYWNEPPPSEAGRIARGKWLFRQKGCFTCHGVEGKGGVANWNYVKGNVPALNVLAERLMLKEKEDAQRIIDSLARGVVLESLASSPPVPRFNVVLAQYDAIRQVIRKGNPPGKKDPQGVAPPLEMPAWQDVLTDADIDSLIAYLLTLQPWEEEDKK